MSNDDDWHQVTRRRRKKDHAGNEKIKVQDPIKAAPITSFSALEVEKNDLEAKDREKRRLKQRLNKRNDKPKFDAALQSVLQVEATPMSGHNILYALLEWFLSLFYPSSWRSTIRAGSVTCVSPNVSPFNTPEVPESTPQQSIQHEAVLSVLSEFDRKANMNSHSAPTIRCLQDLAAVSAPFASVVTPTITAHEREENNELLSSRGKEHVSSKVIHADNHKQSSTRPPEALGQRSTEVPYAVQSDSKETPKLSPYFVPDWAQGHFISATTTEGAHADVVSAVAMSGETVLSSGYEGAVKVWRWQEGFNKLQHVRNLIGHTGRVEAVSMDVEGRRAASSGKDSTLKVWDIRHPVASPLASFYVYESVRSMDVDWSSNACVALGCQSGCVSVWDVEKGCKLQVLKGHSDAVSAVDLGGKEAEAGTATSPHRMISGSRSAEAFIWDMRAKAADSKRCQLNGIRGRVCSISSYDHTVYIGDYSSTIKEYDLRGTSRKLLQLQPVSTIPNVPKLAGDICPVAALHLHAEAGILVSSSMGWWAWDERGTLVEAPDDVEDPVACLNFYAVPPFSEPSRVMGASRYMFTLPLSSGLATCMSWPAAVSLQESHATKRMVVGLSSGDLIGLSMVNKSTYGISQHKAHAEERDLYTEGLNIGLECVLSDDEED
ncbi:hypothetical protein CEUSTIGMA_g7457.t1 [Chlamydomonas eustigma]|uniref:Uncharacterized protein n=1 Tax=Chlamydomonas eustigma TaxID=1157962 RepID=A0A250XAB1_9CHLO|nr:hypothetical protein CEUSTIGMA_g7457.t1 [Chlamydomonas eustigma]|eukprot:GAX80018.1 hypothetical protein CEUSTIGMA_g7457.t1 [Chlamydomonas eustigma]